MRTNLDFNQKKLLLQATKILEAIGLTPRQLFVLELASEAQARALSGWEGMMDDGEEGELETAFEVVAEIMTELRETEELGRTLNAEALQLFEDRLVGYSVGTGYLVAG